MDGSPSQRAKKWFPHVFNMAHKPANDVNMMFNMMFNMMLNIANDVKHDVQHDVEHHVYIVAQTGKRCKHDVQHHVNIMLTSCLHRFNMVFMVSAIIVHKNMVPTWFQHGVNMG